MKQLNLYWLGGGGGSSVPDGRTVTPVNDVTLLQQCAGIANPTYTSLSQILGDTGILQTILSNQNAVNYLVRCKDFIKQKSVPTMTSNTTPSGLCFSSQTAQTNYECYKAFDGNNSTFFASTIPQVGHNIGYKFAEPVIITSFYYLDNLSAAKIKFQGSNDGVTYTDLITDVDVISSVASVSFNNNTAYQYYRTVITQVKSTSNSYAVYTLRLYSDQGFTDVEDAMRYIGLNNYAANTLLNDSTWCAAICNSTYFERVLNAKAPNMTSNNTPSGVCSDSESSSNAYKAYNNSTGYSTAYTALNAAHGNGYQFPEPTRIYKVVYHGRGNDAYRLNNSVYVQKSKNGSWENIGEPILDNTGNQYSVVRDSEEALTTYRLYVNGGNTYYNSQYAQYWQTIQFYGRRDV